MLYIQVEAFNNSDLEHETDTYSVSIRLIEILFDIPWFLNNKHSNFLLPFLSLSLEIFERAIFKELEKRTAFAHSLRVSSWRRYTRDKGLGKWSILEERMERDELSRSGTVNFKASSWPYPDWISMPRKSGKIVGCGNGTSGLFPPSWLAPSSLPLNAFSIHADSYTRFVRTPLITNASEINCRPGLGRETRGKLSR